ncbi:MAG TPA: alpha/beta family hydrolase [Terriglobales bacterium]|nr:alpha/beta family hydrolase [Terriglobales bacterium]
MTTFQQFADTTVDPPVRGFWHDSGSANSPALGLTHGASSNANSAVLVAIGDAFADAGFTVLRCDLPYRQLRRFGPPRPGDAARDREGLKNAVGAMRNRRANHIFLGGHSYGGRQATLLCADVPGLVDGLLLLSYPLHPPGKPTQLRTQHLPKLQVPCLFVHGTRDPFGSIAEMESALALIPAKHKLFPVEGVGHDLGFKGKSKDEGLAARVLEAFQSFVA